MGKMTDALKKLRAIQEGKAPSKAPDFDEIPARTAADESPATGPAPAEKVTSAPIRTESSTPKADIQVTMDPVCVMALEAEGTSAEEFRGLKRAVLSALTAGKKGGASRKSRAVLIAAPGSGEGEGCPETSTVAVNLALALGENADFRVLLVDANFTAPGIHNLLGLPEDASGLSEVLLGRASAEEVVIPTRTNNVWFMGVGKSRQAVSGLSDGSGPQTDSMAPKKLRAMLKLLLQTFRYVVIDGAAVGTSLGVSTFAPAVDGVLLALPRHSSRKRDAQEAVNVVRNRGGELLGSVLVDVPAGQDGPSSS